MMQLTVNGRRFFYWQKNLAQKKFIVLLHGFPGNHQGLMALAKGLDGYRIIIPDLPACGLSESLQGKHNLKNYSDWLNNFLERLSIHNAIIIGHSFGARLALVFSVNYPKKVERLILITPIAEVAGLIPRIGSLYYKIAKILPKDLQKKWISNKYYKEASNMIIFKSDNDALHKKITDRDITELKHLHPEVHIELFNEFYKFSLIPIGKKIKIKTLIIAGDLDEIAPLNSIKKLAGQLHDVTFKMMKNSGHFLPIEKPLATANIVKNWLKYLELRNDLG